MNMIIIYENTHFFVTVDSVCSVLIVSTSYPFHGRHIFVERFHYFQICNSSPLLLQS